MISQLGWGWGGRNGVLGAELGSVRAPSGSDPISCCPDINECLRFGTCSQLCNNTKGSHVCSCSKNFMKTDNMCKAEGQEGTGTHMGSICVPGLPHSLLWESFALPSNPLLLCPPFWYRWCHQSVHPWQSEPQGNDKLPVTLYLSHQRAGLIPLSWLNPHSCLSPCSQSSPCQPLLLLCRLRAPNPLHR